MILKDVRRSVMDTVWLNNSVIMEDCDWLIYRVVA